MRVQSPIISELIEEFGRDACDAALADYGWPNGQEKLRGACDRARLVQYMKISHPVMDSLTGA